MKVSGNGWRWRILVIFCVASSVSGCATGGEWARTAEGERIPCNGTVYLEFTITEDGSVEDPVVVKSDAGGYFDDSALRAITKWKFKQKVKDGEPISRRASMPLEFETPKDPCRSGYMLKEE